MDNHAFSSTEKCAGVVSNVVQRKCLTKRTGSENLRRAIDGDLVS